MDCVKRRAPRRAWVAGVLGACLAAGCAAKTAATSSSNETATVQGVVTLDGKPVDAGTISFDPANVNRKMAAAASSPIGKDGTYTVTTLVGQNVVTFDLPGKATPKNRLNYTRITFEAKSGSNTFDATLPVR